jgi:guanylate kinase
MDTPKSGIIFVISGPSGSGKTTILNRLLAIKELKSGLIKSISYTTRPKRSKEKHGKDYFFISEEQFKDNLKAKKILEWTKYLGYYYATPKEFVEGKLAAGKHVVLCLDLKGATRIKRLYPKNTVTIFVKPPSLELLYNRIEGRCHRTKKTEIHKRLALARQEVLEAHRFDYSFVNDDLRQVVREIKEVIICKVATLQTNRKV